MMASLMMKAKGINWKMAGKYSPKALYGDKNRRANKAKKIFDIFMIN